MKYRFEYNGNPDFVTIHVTKRIAEKYISSVLDSNNELLNLLVSAEGVESNGLGAASINAYSVTVGRGKAFDRDEVLQNVWELLKIWMLTNSLIMDDEECTQLPTIRQDIRMLQCPECAEVQRREMQQAARDFDSLDY